MIVECKNCSSRFDVEEVMLLPSGRKLKCSSCKSVFFQAPPSDDLPDIEPPMLEPEEILEEEEEFQNEPLEEIDLNDESLGLESSEEVDDELETVLGPHSLANPSMEEEEDPFAEEEEDLDLLTEEEEESDEPSLPEEDFSMDDEDAEGKQEEDEEIPEKEISHPSSRLGWALVVVLLLTLGIGVVSMTQWGEFKWFDINSPFRLTRIEGQWRIHSFGTLLVLGGELLNTSKVTRSIPKMRITLLDREDKSLASLMVVPGRVVSDKMLDESTEDALRTMVSLQGDIKKVKIDKMWPQKDLAFQAIFINPPETAVRYQVDFEDQIQSAATSSLGTKTFAGSF